MNEFTTEDLAEAIQRWKDAQVGVDYTEYHEATDHLHWVAVNIELDLLRKEHLVGT